MKNYSSCIDYEIFSYTINNILLYVYFFIQGSEIRKETFKKILSKVKSLFPIITIYRLLGTTSFPGTAC